MAINQIKVANEAKQDITISKADQILGRLADQTIVAKTVKSIQDGRVNFQWKQADYYTGEHFVKDGVTKVPGNATFHYASELKDIKLATLDISNPNVAKLDVFTIFTNNSYERTPFLDVSYKKTDSTSTLTLSGNSVYVKKDGIYLSLDLMRKYISSATIETGGYASYSVHNISVSFDFWWRLTEFY